MEDALKLVLDDTQVKEDWIKAIEPLFPGQDISSILLFECRGLMVDFDTKEGRERLKSHVLKLRTLINCNVKQAKLSVDVTLIKRDERCIFVSF